MARASSNVLPDDVREFLLGNPEFLLNNSDLLTPFIPSGQKHGDDKVADLQRHMLTRLQEHMNNIKGEHADLMNLLQEHIQRQSRINAAVLAMLDADSFETTIGFITENLAQVLDHDVVALFFEAGDRFPHGTYGGAQVVHEGFVDTLLGEGQDILLEEVDASFGNLFCEGKQAVMSQALVRLDIDEGMPPGLLALGHRDPMYYATGIAAEQIELLGSVIERCIRGWLRKG